jgi:hypothetical protein
MPLRCAALRCTPHARRPPAADHADPADLPAQASGRPLEGQPQPLVLAVTAFWQVRVCEAPIGAADFPDSLFACNERAMRASLFLQHSRQFAGWPGWDEWRGGLRGLGWRGPPRAWAWAVCTGVETWPVFAPLISVECNPSRPSRAIEGTSTIAPLPLLLRAFAIFNYDNMICSSAGGTWEH